MIKSVMDRIEDIERDADEVTFDVMKESQLAWGAADKLIDMLRNLGKNEDAEAVKVIRDNIGWKPSKTIFATKS